MMPLKIQVERVVRPIRASGRRKDRMREELLAHLTATYHEELARDSDEAAALARALRRFGNPDHLRRELQASVPFLERILFVRMPLHERLVAGTYRIGKQPGDSALRYAIRTAAATTICWGIPVFFLLGLGAIGEIHARKTPWPMTLWGLHFYISFIGSLLIGWFLMTLCLEGFRRTIEFRPLRLTKILRACGWCVLTVPINATVAFLVLISWPKWVPSTRPGFAPPDPRVFAPLFWATIASTPFLFAWVGIAGLADRKRYEKWESLPLDR